MKLSDQITESFPTREQLDAAGELLTEQLDEGELAARKELNSTSYDPDNVELFISYEFSERGGADHHQDIVLREHMNFDRRRGLPLSAMKYDLDRDMKLIEWYVWATGDVGVDLEALAACREIVAGLGAYAARGAIIITAQNELLGGLESS